MKTLPELLVMSTSEVFEECRQMLVKHYKGKTFRLKEDFLYAVGSGPMMLVAHMDTVNDGSKWAKESARPMELEITRNVIRNKSGSALGGDDRNGVHAILRIIQALADEGFTDTPHILLTTGEERGGLGVKSFIATKVFEEHGGSKNVRLAIEIDRQGANEYVVYRGSNPTAVENYIESFGFKKCHGSYSDVADLADAYKLCHCNISASYYNQHGPSEHIHTDELEMTIGRVLAMMKDPIAEKYEMQKSYGYSGRGYHDAYDYGDWSEYYSGKYNTKTKQLPDNSTSSTKNKSKKSPPTYDPTKDVASPKIDDLLTVQTYSGFCPECGQIYSRCDCSRMQLLFQDKLEIQEILHLMDNYLDTEDRLYKQLDEYLISKGVKTQPKRYEKGDKIQTTVELEIYTSKRKIPVGTKGEVTYVSFSDYTITLTFDGITCTKIVKNHEIEELSYNKNAGNSESYNKNAGNSESYKVGNSEYHKPGSDESYRVGTQIVMIKDTMSRKRGEVGTIVSVSDRVLNVEFDGGGHLPVFISECSPYTSTDDRTTGLPKGTLIVMLKDYTLYKVTKGMIGILLTDWKGTGMAKAEFKTYQPESKTPDMCYMMEGEFDTYVEESSKAIG